MISWDNTWNAAQQSSVDWTTTTLPSTSNQSSDVIELDHLDVLEVSARISTANAVSSAVTISVLGDIDGTNYEEIDNVGPSYAFDVTPVQNDTVFARFRLLAEDYSKIKVNLENDTGNDVVATVKYRKGYSTR
jgi:hypothetical protein